MRSLRIPYITRESEVSVNFSIRSLALPSIFTKMEKMPTYTRSKTQQHVRVTAFKALRFHAYWKTVYGVFGQLCTSVRRHCVPEQARKELQADSPLLGFPFMLETMSTHHQPLL